MNEESNKCRVLWFCLGIFVIPIILSILLYLLTRLVCVNINVGTNDGWLGFWGGYLGSIIAIGGVFLTLKDGRKNLDKSLSQQQRESFSIARPFFVLKKNNKLINIYSNTNHYFLADDKFLNSAECITDYLTNFFLIKHNKIDTLDISNLSSKRMMAVYIKVNYKNTNNYDEYRVDSIRPDQTVHLISRETMKEYVSNILKKGQYLNISGVRELERDLKIQKIIQDTNYKVDEVLSKITTNLDSIDIYYTTELREKIKLVFRMEDGNLKYIEKDKRLENNCNIEDRKELNDNYNVVDFKQSVTIRKRYKSEAMTII